MATLRQYIRDKAELLQIDNLFVLDGFLNAIPLPPASADVLLTRQAIGWKLDEELREIERVLKPAGIALHLVGTPHPAPPDDELHHQLMSNGYQHGTYHEESTIKCRYWKQLEAKPSTS